MAKQPKARTAVVFVHGQGDQSPMDDLLQLAYTIWETDPKAAAAGQLGNLISVPMETTQDGDIRQLITDRVHGRQFHFYQFYWADLMVGNAVVDVWRWLVRLMQRPQAEIPPTLRLARGILSAVVTIMALLAILMSLLAGARLLSPLDAYGAVASNAYAALWIAAAVGLAAIGLRGRRAVGALVSLSASVLVSGTLFGATLTSLVAGSERVLKDLPLSTQYLDAPQPVKDVLTSAFKPIIAFACAVDSNPDPSPFRAYCERRAWADPPKAGPPVAVRSTSQVACAGTSDPRTGQFQGRCKTSLPPSTPSPSTPWAPSWWHIAAAAHRFVIGAALFANAALGLVWGFASPFLKNVMADSARYFSNDPRNVAQRDKVREKGVKLLERLHATGQYDRIVVVSHSLGTVVAYGMLDHYWGLVCGQLKPAEKERLDEVEDAARDLDHATEGEVSIWQAKYRRSQRAFTRSLAKSPDARKAWVVSDFITLGSPLTYAPLLMADSQGEFIAKMRKLFRLPASPPIPVETVSPGYRSDYNYHNEWIGRATGHHHTLWPSAMFAAVRWTNIYFTNNGLTHGDIVGGPVSPIFGRGVVDIQIDRKLLGGGFLHNEYWKWPGQTRTSAWAPAGDTRAYTRPPYHIARLRQATNLFESDELEAQLMDKDFRA